MKRRLTKLLCTIQRQDSSDHQLFVENNVEDNDFAKETINDETNTIYERLKRPNIVIRVCRRSYRRISKRFRPRASTSSVLQQEIDTNNEDHDESVYQTLSWQPINQIDVKINVNSPDPLTTTMVVKTRSPITWKHAWSICEAKDAVINSPFANIPVEIIFKMFKSLSINDLGNVSLVCRWFKTIVDQDDIWKIKCNTSKKLFSKSFKEMYIAWNYGKYLRNLKYDSTEKYQIISNLVRYISELSLDKEPIQIVSDGQYLSVAKFERRSNSSQAMTIKLSVDIDKTVPQLLSLYEKISKYHEQWHRPAIIQQMILRYYRFLKLKVSYPDYILLMPTLDIEFVWQVHLSHPEMYQNDCIRLFGRLIDHSLIVTNSIEQYLRRNIFFDTCHLYKEHYNEEYCSLTIVRQNEERPLKVQEQYETPIYTYFYRTNSENYSFVPENDEIPGYSYWDETKFEFSSSNPENYENPFYFNETDIIMDSNWYNLYKNGTAYAQRQFQYQLNFLYNGYEVQDLYLLKKSYKRFLYIANKYPSNGGNAFEPLTYAIDSIWRSHMQDPRNYISDCHQFLNYVPNRIPCRSVKLSHAKELNEIWKTEFNRTISTDHLYEITHN
ncbi:hypothetical protein I4U23_001290 [Adineta vaga]|nr:hypothetical protein I4U23_001290 [Adineta vaga]